MKKFESFGEISNDVLLSIDKKYSYFNGKFKSADFVKVLYDNRCGFLTVSDENDFHFAFFADLGKLYKTFEENEIIEIFRNSFSKKFSLSVSAYLKKEVVNVVPNTFMFLSDIEFGDWFTNKSLIEEVLRAYPCYNLVCISSKNIEDDLIEQSNNSREFSFSSNVKVDKDSWFYDYVTKTAFTPDCFVYTIARYPDLLEIYDDYRNTTIPMILPLGNKLEEMDKYRGKGVEVELRGFETKNETYFNSCVGACTKALLYKEVDFFSFYDMEISLNLFNVFEGVRIYEFDNQTYQSLFFYSFIDNEDVNTYDISELKDNTSEEPFEDKMVSDIYTVVPIRYESIDLLKKRCSKDNDFVVNNVITGLKFQDNYEFGNDSGNIVNNSERLEYIDLGTAEIIITEEPHYNYYRKTQTLALYEKPLNIRMMACVDKETHTGVLYLLNLGVKVKPTKYLDEITRNGIALKCCEDDVYAKAIRKTVVDNGTVVVNLYNYLEKKFEINRVGIPRNLILSPFLIDYESREDGSSAKIKSNQIKSSLLYGEALFEDGEELGKIVDNSLEESYKTKYGYSVYDYNTMLVSKVSILQYADTYKDYLAERIDFAVVNLFYLQLVQLEVSAIRIANMEISNFIKGYKLKDKSIKSENHNTSSKFVLDKLEEIQEEYAKTLDFWETQTNYYSSNKLMSSIRKVFDVEKDIASLKRNHKEIQQIYDNRLQNASSRSGVIISIVGIILTLISVLEIYTSAVDNPDEKQYLSALEQVIFGSLSMINVIRIALFIILVYYVIKICVKNYFERKDKSKD